MFLQVSHVFIGVDLGQKYDFTAISVVERNIGKPHYLATYLKPEEYYDLRYLERLPLGTPYPRAVERIAAITRAEGVAGRCTLVVDGTGVGQPVFDLLRDAGLSCQVIPVAITGGRTAHTLGHGKSVPKSDLIATLQILLEKRQLRIAENLPERRRLVEELMSMRSGPTRSGRIAFGAGGRSHDDLVLSLSLACWQAKKGDVGERNCGRLL